MGAGSCTGWASGIACRSGSVLRWGRHPGEARGHYDMWSRFFFSVRKDRGCLKLKENPRPTRTCLLENKAISSSHASIDSPERPTPAKHGSPSFHHDDIFPSPTSRDRKSSQTQGCFHRSSSSLAHALEDGPKAETPQVKARRGSGCG